jgi:hypothetical protein
MDYSSILNKAFKLVRQKAVWGMALLATFLGYSEIGFSSGTGYIRRTNSQSIENTGDLQVLMDNLLRSVQLYLPIIIGGVVVVILLGVVFGVLRVIARGGLLAMLAQADASGSTTFRYGWQQGLQHALRLWLQSLIFALPGLIITAVFGGIFAAVFLPQLMALTQSSDPDPTSLIGNLGLVVLCLCCGGLLLLPIGLVLSIIQRLAQYHLITRSTGVLASIAAGWQMFRQNFTANFVIALIMWGISFGLSIVVGAITGIIGVPVALLSALGSGSANQLLSAAVLLPVAILGLITLALSYTLGTGYTIFTNAIWLQAYHHNSEHTTI